MVKLVILGEYRMSRMLTIATAAIVCFSAPSYAAEVGGQPAQPNRSRVSTGWIGFAVSTTGRVFMSDPGTEGASRSAARSECESKTVRTCAAISVQSSTDVYAVSCGSGSRQRGYLGGSNINMGAARWVALEKARNAGFTEGDCEKVYEY